MRSSGLLTTWDHLEGWKIGDYLTLTSGLSIDKRDVQVPLSKCSGGKMGMQRLPSSPNMDFTFLGAFVQPNLDMSSIIILKNLNTVTGMKTYHLIIYQ